MKAYPKRRLFKSDGRTDRPFLSFPEPLNTQRNEPANRPFADRRIAKNNQYRTYEEVGQEQGPEPT